MSSRVQKCHSFFLFYIQKSNPKITKFTPTPSFSVLTSLLSIQINKFWLINETVRKRTFISLNNSDFVILTKSCLNTKILVTDPQKQ